jgi:hypothetical protein
MLDNGHFNIILFEPSHFEILTVIMTLVHILFEQKSLGQKNATPSLGQKSKLRLTENKAKTRKTLFEKKCL